MNYELLERDKMKLIGLTRRGSILEDEQSFQKEIEELWGKLSDFCVNRWPSIGEKVINPEMSYEVQVWNEEELNQNGRLEVFVGFQIEDVNDVPVDLVSKTLPSTKYISFELQGNEIRTWEEDILQDWIPDSDYWVRSFDEYLYHVQCFHEEEYKGIDNLEESQLTVLVPVEEIDEELKE